MNRSYKNTTIAILLACILTMAIGYAVLNQQLNISGTSHITTNFNVKFTNISSEATGTATNKIDPSYTATTATFNTNLVSPGDSMEYNITVSNNGNTDAELDLITITDSSNPAIVFAYSGVAQGDILKAGSSVIVKVTVTYNPNVTTQPDTLNTSLTFKLDYSQAGVSSGGGSTTTNPDAYLATSWLGGDLKSSNIETIEFVTSNEVPSDVGDNYWDASNTQDGSIMGWYYDSDSDGYYEVTVGQNGGVVANPDSSNMFGAFIYLTSLDVANLDVSKVTNMDSMISDCHELKTVDLTGWDTSNVTNMYYMFGQSWNLTEIVGIEDFDTSSLKNMGYIFMNASRLILTNLADWNVSNVTNAEYAFWSMGSVASSTFTLDLGGWNPTSLKNAEGMFGNIQKTTAIYVSSDWSNSPITNSTEMFIDAVSLVGGNGATYDSSKVDASMANYTTGYFTYRDYNG